MTCFAAPGQAGVRRDLIDRLPCLHAALQEARGFRIQQLEALAAVTPSSPTMTDDPRGQVDHTVRVAAAAALSDINAALHRLLHGTYGSCERCDTTIPLDRLQILPAVRLCMRCQHAEEYPRAGTARGPAPRWASRPSKSNPMKGTL